MTILALSFCMARAEASTPGMGIGQLQHFEDALDGAVLADAAVQRVEDDVGLQPRQHVADVARDVDAGDPKPLAFQRAGAGFARSQRHLSLGRPAAHQDCDVLAHELLPGMRGPARGGAAQPGSGARRRWLTDGGLHKTLRRFVRAAEALDAEALAASDTWNISSVSSSSSATGVRARSR